MTSVRLPLEVEQRLEIISRKRNKSKSEIIKEALENLFIADSNEKDSYEIGCDFFGKYGSGDGSLSTTYKSKLRDKINATKHTN